jgi:hypothetical protein
VSRALAEPAIPARTDKASRADTIVFMALTPEAIRITPLLTRGRFERIRARANSRLCCRSQLGFSAVQLGITEVRNYAVVLEVQ